MACVRATAEQSQVVARYIKVNSKMIQCMDLDSLFGPMVEFTKENGNEIKNKVSEITSGPMARFMTENFAKINATDLELYSTLMESIMLVIGRMARSMVRASMCSRTDRASNVSTEMEKKYHRADY